jgi:hypothetical protein
MSNETAPEILSHKDNRNIQVRLDYILLYRSETKAKIVRVLETWTNTKYAEWYKGIADSKEQKSELPAEDLWVTMSYDQFSLFAYGTIKRDTIKQQVDELVAMKHIQRRVHPVYPYGPPQYLLNRETIQTALDELVIPPNLFDLDMLLVSPKKKRTPQEKYPQGGGKKPGRDPGKIPPGTGEKYPPSNNITKNTNNGSKNQSAYSDHVPDDSRDATASTHTQSDEVPCVPDWLNNAQREHISERVDAAIEQVTEGPSSSLSEKTENPPNAGYEKRGESPRTAEHTPRVEAQQAVAARPAAQSAHREPRLTLSLPELSPKAMLEQQVDQALAWLDAVRIETFKDGRAGYVRTQAARKEVLGLIKGGAHLSESSIRANWLHLYNQPKDTRTGFDWKKKLTIRAFCNNFDNALSCVSARHSPAQQQLPRFDQMTDEEYYARVRRR